MLLNKVISGSQQCEPSARGSEAAVINYAGCGD